MVRFNPTDILTGSYIEEKLLKFKQKNYTVPERCDSLKLEIRKYNVASRCGCNVCCNKCWLVLMLLLKAMLCLISRRLPGTNPYTIFNGMDGYIIYFREQNQELKDILI
jgi:hypothetical protein